ncbi:hypothetical protein [Rhizobium leguminosarum]|uniref:hypothetical protein n=1 Tax=Rhizobium leguminosarum TaxID=384 RepID=UPI001FDEE2F5|nr:hypothetical protein [Rhizobium leguminosarum]
MPVRLVCRIGAAGKHECAAGISRAALSLLARAHSKDQQDCGKTELDVKISAIGTMDIRGSPRRSDRRGPDPVLDRVPHLSWLGHPPRRTADARSLGPGGVVVSAALLHCFYWIRLKWVPVTSPFHNVFVAHLLFFASRVSFFFGGALFSAIFFRHLPELDALPPFAQACVKSVYVAATLFGLFCYSLELARFGQAVEDGPPERGR